MPGTVPASTAAYCRQARRLRGRLGHRPARMHLELRELAARQETPAAARHRRTSSPRVSTTHSGHRRAGAFTDEVASALDGPVLRYTQRRALMRAARRLGIASFEANLIIATVQHERRKNAPDPAAGEEDGGARLGPRFPVSPLVVVLAVEALVAAGAWQVCFGG